MKAGRPLWWAAGLSLFVVLAVVVVVLVRDPRHEVRQRPIDVVRASPAAAAAALADLVAGIQERDVPALSDLAPADDEAAATLLGAVGSNARLLEMEDVTARYIDQVGTYDPLKPEVKFQAEKLNKWRSRGAQPTQTVAQLIRQAGVAAPPA